MKATIPQFELAGAGDVFNLCGEVLRQAPAKPQPAQDNTPDLFTVPITCHLADGHSFTVNVPASEAGETVKRMAAIVS